MIDTVIASGTAAADSATVGSADGRIVFGGLAAETRIAGGEAHDELTLATLGGADTIAAGVSLSGPAPVNVHGGDAADMLRYSGTPGGDTISSSANGSRSAPTGRIRRESTRPRSRASSCSVSRLRTRSRRWATWPP